MLKSLFRPTWPFRVFRRRDSAATAWQYEGIRRLAVSLVLAVLLNAGTGCGTTPHGDFKRLEIIVVEPESEPEPSEAPSKGESAVAGVAVGATTGLLYSGLLSLACGPLFAACFAASVPVTVGATALAGGAMGLASSGIPAEDAEKIAPHLQALDNAQKLSQEVAAAVSRQFPASKLAPPGEADARLHLAADRLRVVSGLGEKFGFALLVTAGYEWKLDQKEPTGYAKKYYCQTAVHTTGDWLQEEGGAIEQEVNQCIGKFAAEIYDALKLARRPASFLRS
jgi:hypothetical protein